MSQPSHAENVAQANEKAQTPFLKLNVDCVEKWFEFLSVKNLLALRQTCKWMKVLADHYINTYYPSAFKNFIILDRDEQFKFESQSDVSTLNLVKDVYFKKNFSGDSMQTDFEPNTQMLNRLERLIIDPEYRNNEFEFYETFLKHCTQLKYLSIYGSFDDSPVLIGSDNSWLFREYPTLERIDLRYMVYSLEIIELETFFELNPTVQTFTVDFSFLLTNQNWILNSNITIDLLVIDYSYESCESYSWDLVFDIINRIYERGFYKRLHFNSSDFDLMSEIGQLKGLGILSLESILPADACDVKPLAQLTNLKELDCDDYGVGVLNSAFANHAQNFIHLEKISYGEASLEDVLPFIHHLKKMKIIRIKNLLGGPHFHNNVIDVEALNKERKMLGSACKITLYVNEEAFLATKWVTDVNLDLIKVKRCAEYERKLFIF